MGKVRSHIVNDSAALAQWVGRKLRNHNPMKHRDKVADSHSRANSHGTRVKDSFNVFLTLDAGRSNQVFYELENGRIFQMTVEEIQPAELPSSSPKSACDLGGAYGPHLLFVQLIANSVKKEGYRKYRRSNGSRRIGWPTQKQVIS